jgi:hypothetical protein
MLPGAAHQYARLCNGENFIGEERMTNKLLVGTTVLVAAIGIAGCGKTPPGETSHTPTNSERAQQGEQQPTEPQQHSEQAPTQAAPGTTGQSSNSGQATSGQSEQASKPSQAPTGGTEQQTQSGQVAPEQTGQPSTRRVGSRRGPGFE